MTGISGKSTGTMKAGGVGLMVGAGLALAGAAHAQQRPTEPDRLKFTASVGVISAPSFLGDDARRVSVFPNISVSYGDRFKASLIDAEYVALSRGNWDLGVVLNYDMGRKADGKKSAFTVSGKRSTDLVGMPNITGTLEAGGFVTYSTGKVEARVELRKGVTGGHSGMIGEASLAYKGRFMALGPPIFFSVGPSAKFGDASYNSTFFDVTAAQSAATGISTYDAGAGMISYGVGASAFVPLSERVSLVGFLQMDQLTGDAGNSSIVRERGSKSQMTAGLFLNYTF